MTVLRVKAPLAEVLTTAPRACMFTGDFGSITRKVLKVLLPFQISHYEWSSTKPSASKGS